MERLTGHSRTSSSGTCAAGIPGEGPFGGPGRDMVSRCRTLWLRTRLHASFVGCAFVGTGPGRPNQCPPTTPGHKGVVKTPQTDAVIEGGAVVGVGVVPYRPMTLVELAGHLSRVGTDVDRWRLIAEMLEEYRHEPAEERAQLLAAEPGSTGDPKWDVFLAALAEHLAIHDLRGAPDWAYGRRLYRFWFPFNTAAARADAIVHGPAAFRSRGIFIAPQELNVA